MALPEPTFIPPTTSSFASGVVVPIPTLFNTYKSPAELLLVKILYHIPTSQFIIATSDPR